MEQEKIDWKAWKALSDSEGPGIVKLREDGTRVRISKGLSEIQLTPIEAANLADWINAAIRGEY